VGKVSFFKKVEQDSFLRATAWLSGGTIAAQLVTVAALPILTRLYGPEDFEILAVYLALLGVFSSTACLRFDIAIPVPMNDKHGADLLVAAILSAVFCSLLILIPVLIWPKEIEGMFGVPGFAKYLWLLPLGVASAGIYSALQYWSSRMNRFPLVARSRLVQAGLGVGTQVGLGVLLHSPVGLLFGHMLYKSAGSVGLGLALWKQDRSVLAAVSHTSLVRRISEYRRFPTYSTIEAFSNSSGVQIPLLLIAAFSLGPEAGFVLLAMRVIGAPMQMVGSSITQVYLAKAPGRLRKGELYEFTIAIIKPLVFFGIPLLSLIAILAPAIFEIVFGAEWRRSGVLLQWMAPWFIFQLLASPLSTIFHVTGEQRLAMNLQIFGLLFRGGVVFGVGLFASTWVAEAYAVSGAVFYAIFFFFVVSTMRSHRYSVG
jgi:O-antigen/teichoic acid export membrane protein